MNRQFYIFTDEAEKCTVKEEELATIREFSDILEAISYVREQRGDEKVDITSYGPTGMVVFTETI